MSGPNKHVYSAVVGGTGQKVGRGRVVFQNSDYSCLEMSSAGATSFAPMGISQLNTQDPPGTPFDTSMYAGQSGDTISVFGNGSIAHAECGATVAAGQYVSPGTDARIVPSISFGYGTGLSFCHVVGKALEGGTTGDVVRMEVNIFAT